MNDDHFDGLVNDATHAVTNLIPDTVLDGLRDRERSDLLFQINDALTPILRDVIDRTDTDNPTRASTVAALISELLETHAQKCDEGGDCEDDRPPHVISEIHGTSANIDSIASCDMETGTQIYLVLDDRTSFRITVEAIAA
ncbi:hypothetical protein HY78_24520 [Rhizorhabdus wittichii DC-6]|jgi:hypothetical protein|uniref:Uncharacterized protein n=2 Tax=Sphingomonadales TaxID=204457 RepID=U2YGY9_9SPHN|nr:MULTISPECIES: hypothetical protein [Sphingomonadales]ARR56394.1 hypothetical protein HY78_24520 [Rhizorhabdus wittichii DC-6]EZP70531.1 hypothetical protein BV96_03207 [Sphingomonas paucimobilis]TXH16012.1 MAG: hypothetical protein E6R00_06615 [Gammaproteobacteria bacterium]AMK24721.1 hypothetical protein K426_18960 [Sphingobium sp. TKS]AZI37462.1 hypothetical protein EGO55_17025 [Caenibius tardaugens NBRC 16725]